MTAVLVWTRRLYGGVLGLSGRIHNLFYGFFVPCHTIVLLYKIKNLSLSYDTLQMVLHNILMDNKEVWDIPGATCACEANLSSHGRYKFTVCLDCSVLPSDRFMTRGLVTGLIFLSGAPGGKNPCCFCIFNGLVDFIIYFGCVEQGFLLWIFYALYGGVVYYCVYSSSDVVFSFSVENSLILFIFLFII